MAHNLDLDGNIIPEDTSYETGYHWRDGWYFKRLNNGDVRITRALPISFAHPFYPQLSFSIPANEWASIIASVSIGGETSETYEKAKIFHG